MLTEIRCSKFIDEGVERPPVKFSKGLNVVLGSSTGTNSIGKSTFLLIVDFAFGGNAYSRQKDIIENVGPHEIGFCFYFEGINHRFLRSPVEPATVWKCDERYSKLEALKIEEFKSWLAQQYGLAELGGTFRSFCGTFFRVHGKDNHDPGRPLAASAQEAKKDGVIRLLRLLGRYAAIEEAQNAFEEAAAARRVFCDSLSRNFIASAGSKRDVKQNETRIAAISSRISELEGLEHADANELDPLIAEQLADARSRLSELRRKRTRLVSNISAIEADEDLGRFRASKDFGKLLEFFPNANIGKIDDIEAFHSKLNSILKDERKERKESLYKSVSALDESIEELCQEIEEIGLQSNLTIAVLKEYSSIAIEKRELEDANASYYKKEELVQAGKDAKEHRDVLTKAVLFEAQAEVNNKLVELNRHVCGEGVSVPRLSLPKLENYSFAIANDSGTGSQVRAMALLDLALLELTPLPVIGFDTVESKHISDEWTKKLFELYKGESKQVFVTFDKAESYGSGEVLRMIEESVVLRLSEGHELFGWSWSDAPAEKDGSSMGES